MADADVKTEQDEGTVNVKSEVKSEIPDDVELKRVTLKILGEAKLEEITKKTVRRSLEGALGLDPLPCHPPLPTWNTSKDVELFELCGL